MKLMKRVVTMMLILILAFASSSISIFADTDMMLKDKTNKLKLSDDIKKNAKTIKEEIAAGKSLTYNIEVSVEYSVFFDESGTVTINSQPNIRVYAVHKDATGPAGRIDKSAIDGIELIKNYKYIELKYASDTPATANSTVNKSSKSQKAVIFELSVAPVGTYEVYENETTFTPHANVSAGLVGATLTLTHSGDDIPVGTYYISVTEIGKDESDRLALTVAEPELTGTVTINGTLKYGETLTAVYTPGNNTGNLSYQWKRVSPDPIDSTDIGSNTNTYTIIREDIGHIIRCDVTGDQETDSVLTEEEKARVAQGDGPLLNLCAGLSGHNDHCDL